MKIWLCKTSLIAIFLSSAISKIADFDETLLHFAGMSRISFPLIMSFLLILIFLELIILVLVLMNSLLLKAIYMSIQFLSVTFLMTNILFLLL